MSAPTTSWFDDAVIDELTDHAVIMEVYAGQHYLTADQVDQPADLPWWPPGLPAVGVIVRTGTHDQPPAPWLLHPHPQGWAATQATLHYPHTWRLVADTTVVLAGRSAQPCDLIAHLQVADELPVDLDRPETRSTARARAAHDQPADRDYWTRARNEATRQHDARRVVERTVEQQRARVACNGEPPAWVERILADIVAGGWSVLDKHSGRTWADSGVSVIALPSRVALKWRPPAVCGVVTTDRAAEALAAAQNEALRAYLHAIGHDIYRPDPDADLVIANPETA